MSRAGEHLEAIDIVAYARGSLQRGAAQRVREHCRACASCGDELAAVLLLRQHRQVHQTRAWHWRPAAAAAVIAMALAAGYGWLAARPAAVAVSGSAGIRTEAGGAGPDAPLRSLGRLLAMHQGTVGAAATTARDASLERAIPLLAAGDFAGVVRLLEPDAAALDPASTQVLGLALAQVGRQADAWLVLESAVRQQPSRDTDEAQALAWLLGAQRLGELQLAAGERDAARATLQRAVAWMDAERRDTGVGEAVLALLARASQP